MQNEIKVVEGDGSELEISPVYDHINNIQKPRKKQEEKIIIPKARKDVVDSKNKKGKKEEDNEDEMNSKNDNNSNTKEK